MEVEAVFFPIPWAQELADAPVKTDEMQEHCHCSSPETNKGQQA